VLAIAVAGEGSLAPLAMAKVAASKANIALKSELDPSASPIDVQVGQGPKFSHIAFRGAKLTSSKREGDVMVLRFAARTAPLLPRLHVDPPPYLKDASASVVGGAVEIRLTVDKDVEARVGEADGASFVNLTPAGDQNATTDVAQASSGDPTPPDGQVHMQAQRENNAVKLRFPWRAPLGAAVFRRGDGVYVIFDAAAAIDTSALENARLATPKGPVQGIRTLSGKTWSGVRVSSEPGAPVGVSTEGGVWTVTLGAPQSDPAQTLTAQIDETGPVGLKVAMAGATNVAWVTDPVIGDRLAVVPALAPSKGFVQKRSFVGGTLLQTAQGLALEVTIDRLTVSASPDVVMIGGPTGLPLSASGGGMRFGAAAVGDPQPAPEPAVVDFTNWRKSGEEGFTARYNELMANAAEEAGAKRPGKVQARMALARFLLGSELSFETIGVLNMLAKSDANVLGNAEFRGLRGVAKAMAGRYKDAVAEFSSPALSEERSAALWRGYVATKLGDYKGARQQFAMGRGVIGQFSGNWKSRLARADAESALAVGDVGAAQQAIGIAATAAGAGADEDLAVKLVEAKLLEAAGHAPESLALYDEAAKSSYGALSAPATLRALQIRLGLGQVKSADAAGVLDSLRYRWRGDATELEVVRTLAQLNLTQGRYRQALEVLNSAARYQSGVPAAAAIQADLTSTFRALFLEGRADGMQPIEAVGLFFDFKELTPIGADGDAMVRKLARRLVDIDLLPKAEDLLKYQSEQRLEGVARADVATDLATIYLMDRKPELALGAINNSRTTVLPAALNAQRRLVEARALMALGRSDHALEVLGADKTPEGIMLKAEAAWTGHDWPRAGGLFETMLADRWKNPQALSADEEARLIRAGVAYSLAADEASLTRLRTRYAKQVEAASSKDALKVALTALGSPDASPDAYGRAVAQVDTFSGWVAQMKKKFMSKGAPVKRG
jgi:tetratricopeptide (TPR) repeat protein